MIGVKFLKSCSPYGAGDTALLPEDAAQVVVDSGEAELYEFPANPHAHEAGYQPSAAATSVPVVRPTLSIKKKK